MKLWEDVFPSRSFLQSGHAFGPHKTLTRPSRSADLAGLDLRFLPEGVPFARTKLAKQTKQEKGMTDFFIPAFPHNAKLCLVEALWAYEKRTEAFKEHTSKLFIATIKPCQPVS